MTKLPRPDPAARDAATWTAYAAPGGYINYACFDVCKIKVSTGVISSCCSSKVMNAPFDDSSMSHFQG
ncbi:hypothetical protein [Streptomyces sp. RKAG293]|uniref:hypothetical protein n=1 Tax=Streptomyces sp. RKAG293 TaxID=2893403 RepID=UPI002033AAC2|nr:hypothetical protein [Streptomyces sp. RKAG293]MCM2417116.1 hypothetical protein [Streptomyces sp. RKAG293]